MKFCESHWDELREKIRERGLYGLVATSGEQAAAQMVSQVQDGASKANFDPLMGAHNAIVSNALYVAGLPLMMQNDDGSDRCPLCYLVDNCPCGRGDACPFRTWTTRAADDMREAAIGLGLMATDSSGDQSKEGGSQ